jgi:hypothetical protein
VFTLLPLKGRTIETTCQTTPSLECQVSNEPKNISEALDFLTSMLEVEHIRLGSRKPIISEILDILPLECERDVIGTTGLYGSTKKKISNIDSELSACPAVRQVQQSTINCCTRRIASYCDKTIFPRLRIVAPENRNNQLPKHIISIYNFATALFHLFNQSYNYRTKSNRHQRDHHSHRSVYLFQN